MEVVLLMLVGTAVGVVVAALQAQAQRRAGRRLVEEIRELSQGTLTPEEWRRRRVELLTSTLRDADGLLAELAAEMESAHQRAEELRQEVERRQALAALTEEQSQAISDLVGAQLDAGERRSFRKQFLLNFAFFMAGVVVTIIATAVGG